MPAEKTTLITGANKGIGLAVARALGRLGHRVLIGARDPGRGASAARALADEGLAAEALHLDVTDPAQAAAAADEVARRHGRLDVLVNNAAVTGDFNGPPSEATAELMREVYDTNVFGVVTVTNALLPLLRKAPAARIVNLSSDAASLTLNAAPGGAFSGYNLVTYQSSKTALNAVTLAYAKELRETGIKVNAANPGFTATDLNQHRGHRTVDQAAVIVVRLATLPADGPTGTSQDENGEVPW